MEEISKACDNIFQRVTYMKAQAFDRIQEAERKLQELVDRDEAERAELAERSMQRVKIKQERNQRDSKFNSTTCSPRMTRSRARLLDQSSINISNISLAESTIWEIDPQKSEPSTLSCDVRVSDKPDIIAKTSIPDDNIQEKNSNTDSSKRVLRKPTKLPAPGYATTGLKPKALANQANQRIKLTTTQVRNHFASSSANAKKNEGKVSKPLIKQYGTQIKTRRMFTHIQQNKISRTLTNISIMKELCVLKPQNLIPKTTLKTKENNKIECKEMVLYKPKGNTVTEEKLKTATAEKLKTIEPVHADREDIPVLMGKLEALCKENIPPFAEGTPKIEENDKSKDVETADLKVEGAPIASLNQVKLDQTFIVPGNIEIKKSPNIEYNFNMLRSDDSTDEEGKTSKRPAIPTWSRSPDRENGVEIQHYLPMKLVDVFFSVEPISPRAEAIFSNLKKKILRRESSLLWKVN